MIVVRVLQVEIVLSEQYYKVGVVGIQLFRYLTIRLAQAKSIYIAMTSYSKVFAYGVFSFSRHVVEHHNGIGVDLVGKWYLFDFTVRVITHFVVGKLCHQVCETQPVLVEQ